MNVSVLGYGRWGSFLAWYMNSIGHHVTLYGRKSSDNFAQLVKTRQNSYVKLDPAIRLVSELDEALKNQYIFISINSQNLRMLMQEISKYDLKDKTIVLCMKGIEEYSGKRLTEVAAEYVENINSVAIWVGPGHIQDFVTGIPDCMLVDAYNDSLKKELAQLLNSRLIRIYIGTDVIGNEIGAAAKNAYGIAAGMLDALGYGSLKGAMIVRSAVEVSRLVESLGGSIRSVYGLCFLGECETTFFSKYSNNRLFGENFINGIETNKLCEGIYTVKALCRLAETSGIEMPICQSLNDILQKKIEAQTAFSNLFLRSMKEEF